MGGWANRVAAIASAAICVGFFLWTRLHFGGQTATVVLDDSFMTITPAIAGLACGWRAFAHGAYGRERRFWLLWGASYLSFALGMVYWDYAQIVNKIDVP